MTSDRMIILSFLGVIISLTFLSGLNIGILKDNANVQWLSLVVYTLIMLWIGGSIGFCSVCNMNEKKTKVKRESHLEVDLL